MDCSDGRSCCQATGQLGHTVGGFSAIKCLTIIQQTDRLVTGVTGLTKLLYRDNSYIAKGKSRRLRLAVMATGPNLREKKAL